MEWDEWDAVKRELCSRHPCWFGFTQRLGGPSCFAWILANARLNGLLPSSNPRFVVKSHHPLPQCSFCWKVRQENFCQGITRITRSTRYEKWCFSWYWRTSWKSPPFSVQVMVVQAAAAQLKTADASYKAASFSAAMKPKQKFTRRYSQKICWRPTVVKSKSTWFNRTEIPNNLKTTGSKSSILNWLSWTCEDSWISWGDCTA